jgi:biopolymer transport protein ExbD
MLRHATRGCQARPSSEKLSGLPKGTAGWAFCLMRRPAISRNFQAFTCFLFKSGKLAVMRRFSTRNPLHTLAELNVTPLLDLCFVLLIIFMITTPLMENGVDLVVPSSATAETQINPAETQIIQIDRNDSLKLNGEVTSRANLETQLTALKARDPQISVVVRPDRELAIQKFIDVMDILKRVGIGRVGVMTRREGGEQGSDE